MRGCSLRLYVMVLGLTILEPATSSVQWLRTAGGEDCSARCARAWMQCSEDYWPNSFTDFKALVSSQQLNCTNVNSTTVGIPAPYNPSISSVGDCGWLAGAGPLSRRCALPKAAGIHRLCPCQGPCQPYGGILDGTGYICCAEQCGRYCGASNCASGPGGAADCCSEHITAPTCGPGILGAPCVLDVPCKPVDSIASPTVDAASAHVSADNGMSGLPITAKTTTSTTQQVLCWGWGPACAFQAIAEQPFSHVSAPLPNSVLQSVGFLGLFGVGGLVAVSSSFIGVRQGQWRTKYLYHDVSMVTGGSSCVRVLSSISVTTSPTKTLRLEFDVYNASNSDMCSPAGIVFALEVRSNSRHSQQSSLELLSWMCAVYPSTSPSCLGRTASGLRLNSFFATNNAITARRMAIRPSIPGCFADMDWYTMDTPLILADTEWNNITVAVENMSVTVDNTSAWSGICQIPTQGSVTVERTCVRNKDGELGGNCESWPSNDMPANAPSCVRLRDFLWKYSYSHEWSRLNGPKCTSAWYTLGLPVCDDVRYCLLGFEPFVRKDGNMPAMRWVYMVWLWLSSVTVLLSTMWCAFCCCSIPAPRQYSDVMMQEDVS